MYKKLKSVLMNQKDELYQYKNFIKVIIGEIERSDKKDNNKVISIIQKLKVNAVELNNKDEIKVCNLLLPKELPITKVYSIIEKYLDVENIGKRIGMTIKEVRNLYPDNIIPTGQISTRIKDLNTNKNIIKLEDEFIGTGEVDGFIFTKLEETESKYLYQVNCNDKLHYEVFDKIQVELCVDFKNKIFTEIIKKEVYPSAKHFGLVAWTFSNIENAKLKLN